jgi:N-acetylmuramoyl-L-alanine amidase
MATLVLFHYSEQMAGKFKPLLRKSITIFLCFLSLFAQAQDKLEVKAEKGDGIFSLLAKYNLNTNQRYLDSFLEYNNLGPADFLILGKSYTLPIVEVEYDGKSIRSTLGMEDMEKAKRIQAFNDALLEKGRVDKRYTESKRLLVPILEYKVKSSDFEEYTMTVPILGKDYQEVTITDHSLEGCVYYLVSGHGGPDPGAMGKKEGNHLCEDEYAYDVILRLARNLISHGAKVYVIIRDPNDGIRDQEYLEYDKDEVCWYKQRIPVNQKARLKQRTDVINKLYEENRATAKMQRMVSIHVDSRHTEQKIDIFFYHYPGSQQGYDAASIMLNTIRDKYTEHQKNREYRGVVKGRDLYVLREAKPPCIFIELGNITNDFDQKRILIVNNRQAIANWLSLGIQKDAEKVLAKN